MDHLTSSAVAAVAAAILAACSPLWLARIPEPAPDPGDTVVKPLYGDLAARSRLKAQLALIAFVVASTTGWAIESRAILPMVAVVTAVGVLLAYVDWHTRLLPTRIIAPSYVVVLLLLAVAALTSGDWPRAGQSLIAGLAVFALFFVAWFIFPRGMGYGDVRLSGILGIALGWLGWTEVLVGIYAGFVVGAVGGLALSRLRIVDGKAFPFGPFMLIGAWFGALYGPAVANFLT